MNDPHEAANLGLKIPSNLSFIAALRGTKVCSYDKVVNFAL